MRFFILFLGIFLFIQPFFAVAAGVAFSEKVNGFLAKIEPMILAPAPHKEDSAFDSQSLFLLERFGLSVPNLSLSWEDLFLQECLRYDITLLDQKRALVLNEIAKKVSKNEKSGIVTLQLVLEKISEQQRLMRLSGFDPLYATGAAHCPTDTGDIFLETKIEWTRLQNAAATFGKIKGDFLVFSHWNLDSMAQRAQKQAQISAKNWINEQLRQTGLSFLFSLREGQEAAEARKKEIEENRTLHTSDKKKVVFDDFLATMASESKRQKTAVENDELQAWLRDHRSAYAPADETQARLTELLFSRDVRFPFTAAASIAEINRLLPKFTEAVKQVEQKQCVGMRCIADN